MADEPKKKTREELLAAREEREAEARRVAEEHKTLVLELEDRFCSEYGIRGQAWEMANEDNTCGEGPVCVKLGDPVLHKSWIAKPGAAMEDQFAYVGPCVIYPARELFLALAYRRPQILSRVVQALTNLFGFSQGVLQGKL